jgi:1A family penicillin-binding protein
MFNFRHIILPIYNSNKFTKMRVTILLFFSLLPITFAQDLPPINLHYSSYAISSDGRVIGFYGEKNRVDLKSTGYVSKYVIWSLLATEDRDFYNHHGVSIKGIVRGIFKTLTGHVEGGSTLTMQLARNLFLNNKRTISRKIEEIELAKKLEEKFSKDQILLLYLNTVYFGHGAYGIWAASEEYFGKTPDKLSITESAALVGLVQSPSGYDPQKDPEKMFNRRNEVLHNLLEIGKLTQNEYEKLKRKPLGLNLLNNSCKFVDEQVRKEAVNILNQKGIYLDKDELKIFTTIDWNIQKAAENAVQFQWQQFPNSMKSAQIGLISVEPGTGMIRALIGGNPNADPRGLDRAIQIKRQAGSLFKVFLYGSLLEKGYTLAEPLKNIPIVVDSGTTQEWRPENDDNEYSDSLMPMEKAIQHSINLCAAYAITKLTSPDSIVSFAHRLGITSDIPPYPSIALGTAEVSPLEMASSFAVFADEGIYSKPFLITKIEDKNGRILYSREIDTATVLDSATAFLIASALKTVVDGGTASVIRKYYHGLAAGKTGTTQNSTDAWFVGFTPYLSTAIWVGFDNPQTKLSNSFNYGGTTCAPIWGRMMAEVSRKMRNLTSVDFVKPKDVSYLDLCEDSGEPVTGLCSHSQIYPVNMNRISLIKDLHNPYNKIHPGVMDLHIGR